MSLYISTCLGWLYMHTWIHICCMHTQMHMCIRSYLWELIFPHVLDGCVHTWTDMCMKSYVCQFIFSWISVHEIVFVWILHSHVSHTAMCTHVYKIIYVLIYIFMGLGQLCGCLDTYVWNHLCANFHSHTSWMALIRSICMKSYLYSHASWMVPYNTPTWFYILYTLCLPMCLRWRPTTHQHDFIYYIHVCLPTCLRQCPTTHQHDFIYYIHVCPTMLTQPSKTHGNIKHNFIHTSVSVCRVPSEMRGNVACTVIYICIKSAECRVNLYSHASWTAV